jgi:hypothetical protein
MGGAVSMLAVSEVYNDCSAWAWARLSIDPKMSAASSTESTSIEPNWLTLDLG